MVSRGSSLLCVLGAFVAAGVAILLWQHAAAADAGARCASVQSRSDARARIVTGVGPRISVIGDSYAMGTGLSHIGRSWPAYLHGTVRVDGFAGSGFTRRASRCADVAFADRSDRALASGPDLVVVEGGLNDYRSSSPAITAGVRRLVESLPGVRVVIVGPARAPSRADQVGRVDSALAGAADSAGVEYVSTKGWKLEYLPDRLHLTEQAQRAFGERVSAAIASG